VARACFVTATDTGVGKTIVAGALVASLVARGANVCARKPILTGLDSTPVTTAPLTPPTPLPAPARVTQPSPDDLAGLPDHAFLARLSGEVPEAVSAIRLGPALAPHLAAQLSGQVLDVAALLEATRATVRAAPATIVEGVGGLLVPLAPGWDVRRFARELALPVIVVARPGLGTINHTLLTLEAARQAGLDVRAVVLTPWPDQPGPLESSNRETIEELGGVEVATLRHLPAVTQATLAAAGDLLPYKRWLRS
jgi:dethiobiotin synthetase